MKKVFTSIFLFSALVSFSQKDTLTKIKFKVKAKCTCQMQLAWANQPVGDVMEMMADSFMIAVDSGTTGFYLKCGDSNLAYIKIPYQPGRGYYYISGSMACDKRKIDAFEPDPEPDQTFYQ